MSLEIRAARLGVEVQEDPENKDKKEELDGVWLLQAEQRLGRLIECLDDGFIRLVDSMETRLFYRAGSKSFLWSWH